MNTSFIESQAFARNQHRRTTPWGVRLLLAVSILFGVWVDVSSVGASNSAERERTHLLGMTDAHSTVGAIVRTLASRRS